MVDVITTLLSVGGTLLAGLGGGYLAIYGGKQRVNQEHANKLIDERIAADRADRKERRDRLLETATTIVAELYGAIDAVEHMGELVLTDEPNKFQEFYSYRQRFREKTRHLLASASLQHPPDYPLTMLRGSVRLTNDYLSECGSYYLMQDKFAVSWPQERERTKRMLELYGTIETEIQKATDAMSTPIELQVVETPRRQRKHRLHLWWPRRHE